MQNQDYSGMSLAKITGELFGALMVYTAYGMGDDAKEDLKALLKAYIAKGGTNQKAVNLLKLLEGK